MVAHPRRFVEKGWAAALVALAFAASAQAEPAPGPEPTPERVELDYQGSVECPSEGRFVREVSARIRRPVTWVMADGRVHIALSLRQTEGAASGRLEVARRGTPATLREFTALTCSEVASALALVVALALDPNARTEALPEPQPAPPPDAPAPELVPEGPPAAPLRAAAPPPALPPAPVLPRPPSKRQLHYVAWLGAVGGVNAGYAPEALVTLGVSLGARVSWGSWFSPALQLTPLWGKTGSTGPAAELGTFAWSMARLEACPVHVRLAPPLGFSPCVSGELGRLAARGAADGVESSAAERWWVAPGVTAALHLERGSWFVRLSGEGIFPAIRDDFVFREPDRSVHRPRAFSYGGRLGVGFQFGP